MQTKPDNNPIWGVIKVLIVSLGVIWLVNMLQANYTTSKRLAPSSVTQPEVSQPPIVSVLSNPTTFTRQSLGPLAELENLQSRTNEHTQGAAKSFGIYYEKEEELKKLDFIPGNYNAIKSLAREQINLLNDIAGIYQEAATDYERALAPDSAQRSRIDAERAGVLRQKAELLLKLGTLPARAIIAKREQLEQSDKQLSEKKVPVVIRSGSSVTSGEGIDPSREVNRPRTGNL